MPAACRAAASRGTAGQPAHAPHPAEWQRVQQCRSRVRVTCCDASLGHAAATRCRTVLLPHLAGEAAEAAEVLVVVVRAQAQQLGGVEAAQLARAQHGGCCCCFSSAVCQRQPLQCAAGLQAASGSKSVLDCSRSHRRRIRSHARTTGVTTHWHTQRVLQHSVRKALAFGAQARGPRLRPRRGIAL